MVLRAAPVPDTYHRRLTAMTVKMSLSSTTSPVHEESIPWICIFCISGTNNGVSLALAEFNAATGR
jgi:hypothetical protein